VAPPTYGKSVGKGGSVMITMDELDRIKNTVSKSNIEPYITMRNEDRGALHAQSKNRIKNWNNTLEATRIKREDDRIKRLEDEEIARREVDAKEQEFQDELRRQQIEKANRQLHDSQDMVKALKSKMLVSDVMKEQDAQREYRARKEAIQKNIEQNWEELEKQKMEEYDSKMRAKLEREYNKKMENAKAISDQLEEFKINYIKQLKEDMLEGELIKRQTEEDLEREKIRELQRQKKAAGIKADIMKANADQIRMAELSRQKELEEEARIEEFTKKKLEMDQMRVDAVEHRAKNKLEIRQQMIDSQVEKLRALRDNQEQVLNKQVAEAEDKANRLYEEQQRRKFEMKQAIERSRALQIDRKNKNKSDELQEEKDFADFWKVRNQELQLAEQQEREEERLRH